MQLPHFACTGLVDAPACGFVRQHDRVAFAGFWGAECWQQHAACCAGLGQNSFGLPSGQRQCHCGVVATSVIGAVSQTRQTQAILRRFRIAAIIPKAGRASRAAYVLYPDAGWKPNEGSGETATKTTENIVNCPKEALRK